MRFWDSSAILPLVVGEQSSSEMLRLYADDPAMAISWTAEIECVSAIARLEREAFFSPSDRNAALHRLDDLLAGCQEILPSPAVRMSARRLLMVHALCAADALQLASALVLIGQNPSTLPFVCLDSRLSAAASREGFPIVPR